MQDISERVWHELQVRLAALQPGAERVVATRSEHDVPRMQPGEVVREVSRVVLRCALHGDRAFGWRSRRTADRAQDPSRSFSERRPPG